MAGNPLDADLKHILQHTRELWEPLRNGRVFITGGAGFFGCWLAESFVFINQALEIRASAFVLTRDRRSFVRKLPQLADNKELTVVEGDVRDFAFPEGEFNYVIHAATQSSSPDAPLTPTELYDANVEGTRRMLDFAASRGTRRLLFTSSGAIYGPQPSDLTHVGESYTGAPSPLDVNTAYGQSKRASEFLCVARATESAFDALIARCFAFVGPRLPLDLNFAVGNFTRDALAGESIKVAGDGAPFRSYLYAADLMIWLWTILLVGVGGSAYNVGSDAEITITELARTVAEVVNPESKVEIARKADRDKKPQRYVPSTDKARSELGLMPWIDLRQGIRRMAEWYRATC